jgi:hypothetical protein
MAPVFTEQSTESAWSSKTTADNRCPHAAVQVTVLSRGKGLPLNRTILSSKHLGYDTSSSQPVLMWRKDFTCLMNQEAGNTVVQQFFSSLFPRHVFFGVGFRFVGGLWIKAEEHVEKEEEVWQGSHKGDNPHLP